MHLRGSDAQTDNCFAVKNDVMHICGTQSVWTVDLAHVLCRYGVDFTFCTVTDGVRPEYDSEVHWVPVYVRSMQCT